MSDHDIVRVQYFEGQYLRRQDFTDEQEYHLAMRRRHNVGHHVWGIVHGLDLVLEDRTLYLTPGFAVDGYGRELVVSDRRRLDASALQRSGSDLLDVWLLYDRQPSDPAPTGYACATEHDTDRSRSSGTTTPFYRWREEPQLMVRPASSQHPDGRHPEGVAEQDLAFGPESVPPDEPGERWPVFLGRLRLERLDGDDAGTLSIDPAGRPYAGLVAGRMSTPLDDGTRLELGSDAGGDQRFAVYLPREDGGESAVEEPRLEVSASGAIDLRARTTVHGDVEIAEGALDFSVGGARPPADEPEPRPWQLYLQDTDTGERELRIEMEASGEGLNRVAIGAWSEQDEAFRPVLSVADDRTVTVHGDLVVEGLLIRGRKRDEPEVTPEAKSFLLAGYLGGLAGAGELTGGEGDPAAAVLEAVANRLAASPDQLQDFAKLLKEEHPELRQELARQLTGKLGG